MIGGLPDQSRYDVIVVGAGPAGSTAAYHLADGGRREVLVVDRQGFPRHKTRGGALLRCRDWAAEYPCYAAITGELPAHPVESLRICAGRVPWWEGRGGHFFDQVKRWEFDHLLLRTALARPGVAFHVFAVRSVEHLPGGGVRLSDGARELEAKVVVGADGVSSRLARALGNAPRNLDTAGVCRVLELTCERPHETAVVFYLWGGAPGYGYLFPTAAGYHLGVGYLGDAGRRARSLLADLLRHCLAEGLIPRRYEVQRTAATLAPATVADTLAHRDILLVGDAAGLLDQLSGEGIHQAMRSGQLAGRLLAEDLSEAAPRYRRAIRPLVDEVTYVRPLRPRLLGGAMRGYFALSRLAAPLKRPLVNRLFRRIPPLPADRPARREPLQPAPLTPRPPW